MSIQVQVRTVDHNYEELKRTTLTFDNSIVAMAWLQGQYEMPGIGGVEYVTSGSLGGKDEELEFTIHKQQIVFVATATTADTICGKPAIYVSNTIEDLMEVVRKQNGIPDASKDAYYWFEERGGSLHVDTYYVE
jgi:hypothetical protein